MEFQVTLLLIACSLGVPLFSMAAWSAAPMVRCSMAMCAWYFLHPSPSTCRCKLSAPQQAHPAPSPGAVCLVSGGADHPADQATEQTVLGPPKHHGRLLLAELEGGGDVGLC